MARMMKAAVRMAAVRMTATRMTTGQIGTRLGTTTATQSPRCWKVDLHMRRRSTEACWPHDLDMSTDPGFRKL